MNHKLAPLTGALFFVVLVASIVAEGSNTPSSNDSATKVLTYYQDHFRATRTSGVLTVLAVFLGVIFYGQLRDYLRRSDGVRGLTATAFGGVVLFAASGCLSAGALFALTDSASHLSPATAQTLSMIRLDTTASRIPDSPFCSPVSGWRSSRAERCRAGWAGWPSRSRSSRSSIRSHGRHSHSVASGRWLSASRCGGG